MHTVALEGNFEIDGISVRKIVIIPKTIIDYLFLTYTIIFGYITKGNSYSKIILIYFNHNNHINLITPTGILNLTLILIFNSNKYSLALSTYIHSIPKREIFYD